MKQKGLLTIQECLERYGHHNITYGKTLGECIRCDWYMKLTKDPNWITRLIDWFRSNK